MTPPFSLPCVIFAGGKSSRMGRNKALLPFGDAPTLAEFQFNRLSPLFESAYLSVKSPDLFPQHFPMIADEPTEKSYAPTAGFVAAFRTLTAERLFVLSVDTPFVGPGIVSRLLEADTPHVDAVIARTGSGIHPLCGIYHRRLLPRFEAMAASGEHKLGKLLHNSNTVFVDFDNESDFANLNYPEEYEAAVMFLEKTAQRR